MIPCIPLLLHKSQFITGFNLKSEVTNWHLAKQCPPIQNNSQIQLDILQATEKTLSNVKVSKIKFYQ